MPIAEDPDQRPSDDPFEGLVLDEEFVRSAGAKEQAGRTRMLAARWKDNPPHDPGGRRSVNDGPRPKRRFGRRPEPVDPWGNVRRRKPKWRAPLFVALAVAVMLAALNVEQLRGWYADWRGDPSLSDGAPARPVPTVGPETAQPTAAAPEVPNDQPTVARPWAGSPAEGWPAGPDAIVLPEARAVGVFDAAQVAGQLKTVKDFLVASNLDPKVLAAGRPEAALALLDRQDRENAVEALDHPGKETDGTWLFSRFDLREAVPVGDTVKVQGRMSLDGDGRNGTLIRTDYTFVYALRPGSGALPGLSNGTAGPAEVAPKTLTTRTVVRRVFEFRFADPAKFEVEPGKIVLADSASDAANSACDATDGLYHPRFPHLVVGTPEPKASGPTTDPYDRSKDLGTDDDCGTASRT
ncbi:hypothetical protein ACIRBX_09425 [Kitasatospora sp. NPDC096147]|uniref:SCO2583/SCO2584 N-terminal domain-containing protein n=1 Tax=Kitasatospora sp. NPDC096147 TaxID=3364093 RepID=UPI00381EC13E